MQNGSERCVVERTQNSYCRIRYRFYDTFSQETALRAPSLPEPCVKSYQNTSRRESWKKGGTAKNKEAEAENPGREGNPGRELYRKRTSAPKRESAPEKEFKPKRETDSETVPDSRRVSAL